MGILTRFWVFDHPNAGKKNYLAIFSQISFFSHFFICLVEKSVFLAIRSQIVKDVQHPKTGLLPKVTNLS